MSVYFFKNESQKIDVSDMYEDFEKLSIIQQANYMISLSEKYRWRFSDTVVAYTVLAGDKAFQVSWCYHCKGHVYTAGSISDGGAFVPVP
jgi:hypothetical protein